MRNNNNIITIVLLSTPMIGSGSTVQNKRVHHRCSANKSPARKNIQQSKSALFCRGADKFPRETLRANDINILSCNKFRREKKTYIRRTKMYTPTPSISNFFHLQYLMLDSGQFLPQVPEFLLRPRPRNHQKIPGVAGKTFKKVYFYFY